MLTQGDTKKLVVTAAGGAAGIVLAELVKSALRQQGIIKSSEG